jgi:hypothetical protein
MKEKNENAPVSIDEVLRLANEYDAIRSEKIAHAESFHALTDRETAAAKALQKALGIKHRF